MATVANFNGYEIEDEYAREKVAEMELSKASHADVEEKENTLNTSIEEVRQALEELKTLFNNSGVTNNASGISYDNGESGLVADNVQTAIDEIIGKLENVEVSSTAENTEYNNAVSHLISTNVQGAIDEVHGLLNMRYDNDNDMVQVFVNGVWEDWKQGGFVWNYIFKDGVVDTEVSTLGVFGFNGNSGSSNITDEGIIIKVCAVSGNGRRQGVCTELIDLTNVEKICMDFSVSKAGMHYFISLTTKTGIDPYSGNSLLSMGNTEANGTIEYNVSNITGSYYINFGIVCGETTEQTAVLNNLRFK